MRKSNLSKELNNISAPRFREKKDGARLYYQINKKKDKRKTAS